MNKGRRETIIALLWNLYVKTPTTWIPSNQMFVPTRFARNHIMNGWLWDNLPNNLYFALWFLAFIIAHSGVDIWGTYCVVWQGITLETKHNRHIRARNASCWLPDINSTIDIAILTLKGKKTHSGVILDVPCCYLPYGNSEWSDIRSTESEQVLTFAALTLQPGRWHRIFLSIDSRNFLDTRIRTCKFKRSQDYRSDACL